MGSGHDFRDGDAGSTEIRWVMAMEQVSNKGCNFENDALVDNNNNNNNTQLVTRHMSMKTY